jgi:hypothetical protein
MQWPPKTIRQSAYELKVGISLEKMKSSDYNNFALCRPSIGINCIKVYSGYQVPTFFVLYVPCPLPGSHSGLRKDDCSGNGSDNYLGIFRQIGESYPGMTVRFAERNRIGVNIEADGYREITPVGVIRAGPPIIDAVPV